MRMEVGAFRREPSVVAHGLRAGFFLKFSWQLRKNEPRPSSYAGEGLGEAPNAVRAFHEKRGSA